MPLFIASIYFIPTVHRSVEETRLDPLSLYIKDEIMKEIIADVKNKSMWLQACYKPKILIFLLLKSNL